MVSPEEWTHLSPPGRTLARESLLMSSKRTIRAKDIVNDIRAGMTDHELMEKYRLSVKGLQSIFTKLEQVKAVKRSELYSRTPWYDDTVNVGTMRNLPRNYLALSVSIHESENPTNNGVVVDLTEKGVRATGIQVRENQTKALVIDSGDLLDIGLITFKSTCRWTRQLEDGTRNSGFEITNISERDVGKLRQLIDHLSLR
jgi:hypothetical protein